MNRNILMACLGLLLSLTFSLCLRNSEQVIDRPLTEDAYYGFTVARNIATGTGITIDGENWTNGIQPLFTLVCALPYLLPGNSDITALRWILVFSWLVYFASGLLFVKTLKFINATKDPNDELLALACYLSCVFIFWQHLNGLETGILLLLFLTVILAFLRVEFHGIWPSFKFGSLLGLLTLARIDAAILCAIFTVYFIVCKHKLFEGMAIATGGALVSSPWWAYNFIVFGSLMPSSGTAQQSFGFDLQRLEASFHAVGCNLFPWLNFFGQASWLKGIVYFILFGILSIVVLYWHSSSKKSEIATPDDYILKKLKALAIVFLLYCCVIVLYYTFNSWAVHFYRRYFIPISLPAVYAFFIFVKMSQAKFNLQHSMIAEFLVVPIACLITAIWIIPDSLSSNPHLSQLELLEKHVPETERVAAWQSGTIGYFWPAGVVNLDGKVNKDALVNSKRMASYIDEIGVDWICDWPGYLSKLGADPDELGWELIEINDSFKLYKIPN